MNQAKAKRQEKESKGKAKANGKNWKKAGHEKHPQRAHRQPRVRTGI